MSEAYEPSRMQNRRVPAMSVWESLVDDRQCLFGPADVFLFEGDAAQQREVGAERVGSRQVLLFTPVAKHPGAEVFKGGEFVSGPIDLLGYGIADGRCVTGVEGLHHDQQIIADCDGLDISKESSHTADHAVRLRTLARRGPGLVCSRESTVPYASRGLLFCAACGRRMQGAARVGSKRPASSNAVSWVSRVLYLQISAIIRAPSTSVKTR